MSAPDRLLKRLVADLARAREEDIEAVLETLGPIHRPSVERMLAEYRGENVVPLPVAARVDQAPIIEGLSPWLIARLERRGQTGGARIGAFGEMVGDEVRQAGLRYLMTEVAFETLRACAAEMKPASPAANASPARDVLRRRLFSRRAS